MKGKIKNSMLLFYLSAFDDDKEKSRFRKFYNKYIGLMYYVATQLTDVHSEAEDIVHETFLRLISNFDLIRTENEKETTSLVYTVTRYCGIDWLRKNKRELLIDDLPSEEFADETAPDIMVDTVYINDIMAIIADMDPMYAIPLQLKTEGYTISEIASFLGITAENVKVRIHRARKILKDKLEAKL